MEKAETATFFRNQADHYRDLGQIALADDYKLAADALEAVERLEAEREKCRRQGAVEELRRLADELHAGGYAVGHTAVRWWADKLEWEATDEA